MVVDAAWRIACPEQDKDRGDDEDGGNDDDDDDDAQRQGDEDRAALQSLVERLDELCSWSADESEAGTRAALAAARGRVASAGGDFDDDDDDADDNKEYNDAFVDHVAAQVPAAARFLASALRALCSSEGSCSAASSLPFARRLGELVDSNVRFLLRSLFNEPFGAEEGDDGDASTTCPQKKTFKRKVHSATTGQASANRNRNWSRRLSSTAKPV